jgi:hypothetical protein
MHHLLQGKHVRFILILLSAVLASVLLLMGVQGYVRWQGKQYFGEITRLTDSGFVITDAKVKERMIEITSQTVVRRGVQREQDGFRVGDHVVVVGEMGAGGQIRAALIRIVKNSTKILPSRRAP